MFVVFGAQASDMLEMESLSNLRQLMSIGAYGLVEAPAGASAQPGRARLEQDLWTALADSGRPCLWLTGGKAEAPAPAAASGQVHGTEWQAGPPASLSQAQFERLQAWMDGKEWAACLVDDLGLAQLSQAVSSSEYLQALDRSLGDLFANLDDDSVVAVLMRPAFQLRAFVLAAPFAAPAGQVQGATAEDVAATLFHLCGLSAHEDGQPGLFLRRDSQAGLSGSDEAILRERLSGLGYL